MKAADWIDRVKKARGWESDYRVAKELPISHPTISRYRNKPESTMDDETAVKVAAALGAEPELIILDQVAERTKSEPARAAIARALKRLGGVAAGVVLAAGLTAPPPAAAAAKAPATGASEGLRIMSNRSRRRRALAAVASLLQSLTPAPSQLHAA